MKKLSIVLLAIFFIGIANVNAQTDATTETVVETEEVKETKICGKTGKVCDETCKNKAKGTCCKGKTKTSCSKSKGGSFNFTKSNNYGEGKSSCSKKAKKGCCKKKAKKCAKGAEEVADIEETEEVTPSEE